MNAADIQIQSWFEPLSPTRENRRCFPSKRREDGLENVLGRSIVITSNVNTSVFGLYRELRWQQMDNVP